MSATAQTVSIKGLGVLVCDADGYCYSPHMGFTTNTDLPMADELRVYMCSIPGYLYQTGSSTLPCAAPAYYSIASTSPVRYAFMPLSGGVYIVQCNGGSCSLEDSYRVDAKAAIFNGMLYYWDGATWWLHSATGPTRVCGAVWPVYAPGDPALILCNEGVAIARSDGSFLVAPGVAVGWWDEPVYADSSGNIYNASGDVLGSIDTSYGDYGDINSLVYFGKGYGGYKVYVLSTSVKPLPKYRLVYTDGANWYSVVVEGSDEWRLVYPVLKSDGSSTEVWLVSR